MRTMRMRKSLATKERTHDMSKVSGRRRHKEDEIKKCLRALDALKIISFQIEQGREVKATYDSKQVQLTPSIVVANEDHYRSEILKISMKDHRRVVKTAQLRDEHFAKYLEAVRSAMAFFNVERPLIDKSSLVLDERLAQSTRLPSLGNSNITAITDSYADFLRTADWDLRRKPSNATFTLSEDELNLLGSLTPVLLSALSVVSKHQLCAGGAHSVLFSIYSMLADEEDVKITEFFDTPCDFVFRGRQAEGVMKASADFVEGQKQPGVFAATRKSSTESLTVGEYIKQNRTQTGIRQSIVSLGHVISLAQEGKKIMASLDKRQDLDRVKQDVLNASLVIRAIKEIVYHMHDKTPEKARRPARSGRAASVRQSSPSQERSPPRTLMLPSAPGVRTISPAAAGRAMSYTMQQSPPRSVRPGPPGPPGPPLPARGEAFTQQSDGTAATRARPERLSDARGSSPQRGSRLPEGVPAPRVSSSADLRRNTGSAPVRGASASRSGAAFATLATLRGLSD